MNISEDSAKSFILYGRVSSKGQFSSGLSIDAQQQLAEDFVVRKSGKLASVFLEQETASGKRRRPQLDLALQECKRTGSTLLVGNLSRLSRSVSFTSKLLDGNVPFICLDMPDAGREMIQMMSIMAEWEVRQCSKRTKLALAQAKARGVQLGRQGSVLAELNQNAAREYYASIKQQVIQTLQGSRKKTLQSYATKLNKNGVRTRTGGKWHPQTVKNMFKHLEWNVKTPRFM
jgi:DNA invertase Pin-like site-specific DNA recombinase